EVEMVDEEGLRALRESLEADGYRIEIREQAGRIGAQISATPEACEECLVPKTVLLAMLEQALRVPGEAIDLAYPGEPAPWAGA
ncbi:MAG TPA: hypothetical protein VFD49_00405, partial [Candidatus Dormibacteraeota bacterium]|nr:hypothetical protein [Candidatus Dormibacteraeota bacterium]